MSKIDARKDPSVGDVLGDIHDSVVKAQANAIAEYRKASRERHGLLRRMMPQWRVVQQTLTMVNKNVESLLERSRTIDRHLEEYREIVQGTERATQVLSSSSLVQFFVSALVLAVAVAGAAINFSLIARPMAEMVGGTTFIGDFRTSEIAALVIIMVEVSMGLFLMESLRITRLFPVIGALPDKMRVRMVGVTFVILLLLASVEAGLAYMREILMQDELATAELLRGGGAVTQSSYVWITTAAQMGMGFTLPFALVFVAIPLETFVHSLRTVVGLLGIGVLRFVHLMLRLLDSVLAHASTVLVRLYDIPIFMPLWIEAAYRKRESAGRAGRRESGVANYPEVAQ
jgi:ABC-type multidrug transport system fused ATPase/permease subunit